MTLKDSRRLQVKIPRQLYAKAKQLGIDVQTLWNLSLQKAVELVETKNTEEELRESIYPTSEQEQTQTESEVFSAMVRLHTKQDAQDGDNRGRVSERIKTAAERAGRY